MCYNFVLCYDMELFVCEAAAGTRSVHYGHHFPLPAPYVNSGHRP